jgi:hypothetical protein
MAVIIREKRIIGGKEYIDVKVYKSDRFVTREAREKAERLDKYLHEKMKEIENLMKKENLISLKGKPGVIRLWFEVGRRLSFVYDEKFIQSEDRKYVWRALYDHAGEFVPGTPKVRANERWWSSHFFYCYQIGLFPWSFVKAAGNWTAWVEFLDSQRIRQDERIVEWLGIKSQKVVGGKQDWLRKLTKAVRHALMNRDSTVLTNNELYEELNKIFEDTYTSDEK